jgi:hypothetical protein
MAGRALVRRLGRVWLPQQETNAMTTTREAMRVETTKSEAGVCAECKHAFPLDEQCSEVECRRMPPIVRRSSEPTTYGQFPRVKLDWFCAEFRR